MALTLDTVLRPTTDTKYVTLETFFPANLLAAVLRNPVIWRMALYRVSRRSAVAIDAGRPLQEMAWPPHRPVPGVSEIFNAAARRDAAACRPRRQGVVADLNVGMWDICPPSRTCAPPHTFPLSALLTLTINSNPNLTLAINFNPNHMSNPKS